MLALLPGSTAAPAGATPFTVFVDAAHGGPETGTILAPQLLEKDVVLALSIHLRSALTARGMRVVTTRETDTSLDADARAAAANHAHADACIVLHATASGSGVHLYTPSLTQAMESGDSPSHLPAWKNAGAAYITQGLQLASAMTAALDGAAIPYTLGRLSLPVIESMRCPAVAVEVAPLRPLHEGARTGFARLGDAGYQAELVNALAAALVQWRSERPGANR